MAMSYRITSPGPGQLAMESDHGVEQPVDRQPLRLEVDPEVGREEEVGLARLDGDAGRDPPAVEIPGAGEDVVLGDDPAGRHRPRLPLDGQDPVDQHQRLVGEPDAGRVGVDRGELGPEDVADPSRRRTPGTGPRSSAGAGRRAERGLGCRSGRSRTHCRHRPRRSRSISSIWKAICRAIAWPIPPEARRNASCAPARADLGGEDLAERRVGHREGSDGGEVRHRGGLPRLERVDRRPSSGGCREIGPRPSPSPKGEGAKLTVRQREPAFRPLPSRERVGEGPTAGRQGAIASATGRAEARTADRPPRPGSSAPWVRFPRPGPPAIEPARSTGYRSAISRPRTARKAATGSRSAGQAATARCGRPSRISPIIRVQEPPGPTSTKARTPSS